MARTGFEKFLVVIEEAFSRVVGIKDTIEATHHELEPQLKVFRVELVVTKKIYVKANMTLEAANKEVIRLDSFLLEEQASWVEEKEQTGSLSESLWFVLGQLQEAIAQLDIGYG